MMDDEELRLWEGIMNEVFTTDGFSEFRDGPSLVRGIRASRVLCIEDIVEMSCVRAGRKTVHVYHSPPQAVALALGQFNTRIHGTIFIEPECISIASRQRLVERLDERRDLCSWMQRRGPMMSSKDMPVGGLTEDEILMLRCSLDANSGVIRRPEVKDFRIPESDEFHDDATQRTDVEDWVQAVDVADSLEQSLESLESLESLGSVCTRSRPPPLIIDDDDLVSYSSEDWAHAVDDRADSLEDSEYIVYKPSDSTRLTCDGDSLVFYPISRHYPQKDHQVHPNSPIANTDHRGAQTDEDQEAAERRDGGAAEEQPPTLLQQKPSAAARSAPCESQSHSQVSKLSERQRETEAKPLEAKAHERKIVNADLAQTSSEIQHTKDQVLEKSNTDPKARLDVKDGPGQYLPKTYKYNSIEELIAGYKVDWGREEAINIPEQTEMDIKTRLEKMESLWHNHCKKDEENNAALQKRLKTLESLEEERLMESIQQKLTSLNQKLDAFDKDRAAKKTMLSRLPEGQARLVENAKNAELEQENRSLEARLKALEEEHQKLRTEHSSLSATVVDQQETIAAMEHRIEELEGLIASDSEEDSDDEDSDEDSDYRPNDDSEDYSDEYSNDGSYDDYDGHSDDHSDEDSVSDSDEHSEDSPIYDYGDDDSSGRDPGIFTDGVHVLGSDNMCHICAAQHQVLDRNQW
ncbi:hypothetical protein CSOJ01_03033 [Colletotrichum sojae]|uniref:Uncharacterized protein n=1 Tax=Colletotrichum sojae TaxID=2175907 RepID=A0A8H6N1X8_9PEZI|nr:hypothetical protein CSOJ01_03033 [Colletotrichum sojae]